MKQWTVAIVGGGITGLATAWALLQASQDHPSTDSSFSATPGTNEIAPGKLKVIILEADRFVGGKLKSLQIGGQKVDAGPDSFLATRPEGVELCRQVGLSEDLLPPTASKAYIWTRGALRPIPPGLFLGLPSHLGPLARSGILDPITLLRASLDLVLPRSWGTPCSWGTSRGLASMESPLLVSQQTEQSSNLEKESFDRSIGEIVSSRLGKGVANNLVEPLVGGIHAGRIANMSSAAILPQLLRVASENRSLILGSRSLSKGRTSRKSLDFKGIAVKILQADRGKRLQSTNQQSPKQPMFYGLIDTLESLGQRLALELTSSGYELRTSTPVLAIEQHQDGWWLRCPHDSIHADAVVLTTPAWVTGDLLKQLAPNAADILQNIKYSSISLVTFDLGEQRLPSRLDNSSGFLVPSSPKNILTACSFLSNKWKHLSSNSHTLIRASAGRFGDDRCMQLDEGELINTLAKEISEAIHLPIDPQDAVVTRWPNAFPQYEVGHLERVRQVNEEVEQLGGLAVAGAAFGGVGIPACIAQGRRAADRILNQLVARNNQSPGSSKGQLKRLLSSES